MLIHNIRISVIGFLVMYVQWLIMSMIKASSQGNNIVIYSYLMLKSMVPYHKFENHKQKVKCFQSQRKCYISVLFCKLPPER